VIYTMHKIESIGFLEKFCSDNNWRVDAILQRKFRIKRSYEFHTKAMKEIYVGVFRLVRLR